MKIKQVNFLALLIVVLMSCSSSKDRSIDRLNSYVKKVEMEYVQYSMEDWESAQIEFDKLVANVEANYENMTSQEREDAMKAIGRYYGLLAKQGIQSAAQETQKILEALPALIEGFTDVFK